jgi:purine-nucleoside phosphorylase
MLKKVKKTVGYLNENTGLRPKIGIILGTGLGGLVKEIKIEKSISYEEIPHFPVSTVEGHSGRLIFGTIGGVPVVAMQGRFHYYEGYSMKKVTFPVRVMKLFGVETLIVSNASGGMNPDYEVGTIMVINDHINMFGVNPLVGKNYDELGPRFPDMSETYDKELIKKAFVIAEKLEIKLEQGVYLGTTGPTLETPAEYKMFRILGGDAVGMSTVPEVIVAHHMGMRVFGISIVTDLGVEGKIVETSHEEIQMVAAEAEPKMTRVIKDLISEI